MLKNFWIELHWHFFNPKQVFEKVGDVLFAGSIWHIKLDDDNSHEVVV